jgi:coenzyme F420-0:L-glutamate ligase/coenzyme F420-1:gamma-L-glutamate ligase
VSNGAASAELRIIGIHGIPEVQPGDDLHRLIGDAVEASGNELHDDDVLVVTHKIVSKSEGQLVDLRTITPTAFAKRWAADFDKDARQVEVVLNESKRIIRMDRGVLIAETRHGFVCANAGVDQSNVSAETVCLLPIDPDASARAIRTALAVRFNLKSGPGIIISDSFGRPWRAGIVNVAVGVAGLAPLADYRGMSDAAGYELHVSVLAVADELAAAAELVMNKLDAIPVVLIRGYSPPTSAPHGSARDMVLDPSRNLFP